MLRQKKKDKLLRPRPVRYRFVRLTLASHAQLPVTPICPTFAGLKKIPRSGSKQCQTLRQKKKDKLLRPRRVRYRFVRLILASHAQLPVTPICHTFVGLKKIPRTGNDSS